MGIPVSTQYSLLFNNNSSYFYEGNIVNKNRGTAKADQNFIEDYVNGMSPSPKSFYYKEIDKNSIYYNDQTLQRTYDIVDHEISYDWKISGDGKKIGNYSCLKATTNFRGRDYTAYFTEDIPLPYGPNKWFGLPGLILEIYDNDYLYHAQALNVNLSTTDLLGFIEKIKNKKFISYKTFLNKMCEDMDEFASIMQSRLPKGLSNFKAQLPKDPLEILEITCN